MTVFITVILCNIIEKRFRSSGRTLTRMIRLYKALVGCTLTVYVNFYKLSKTQK